jgi:hypothetical protein
MAYMQQEESNGNGKLPFCQKVSKETGEKCGGFLTADGKCVVCDGHKSYAPYATLEEAILDVVNKSKEALQSHKIAKIIEKVTEEKRMPSKIEMQVCLHEIGDEFYKQPDPRGSKRQYYWNRVFELSNLVEMAKPLKERVCTLESYAEQRGISKTVAKKELTLLLEGKKAYACKLDSETLYAANVKALLYYLVKLKPGLNAAELADLAGTKEQYACRRLRELTKKGKIFVEKTPARRWQGRYKYHPPQAK